MNNEEKIIALLEAQGRTLDAHGRILEAQGREIATIKKNTDALYDEVAKINVSLENEIRPKLDLLFEGQKTLLETLAPKNRVEALEDEMAFLKQVIKNLASEVNDLKKAQ